MSLDPRLPVSDHDSDGELSTVGFNDYDTDDEEASTRDTATFSRLEQNPQEWCSCSNCSIMESELESYCCTESSLHGELTYRRNSDRTNGKNLCDLCGDVSKSDRRRGNVKTASQWLGRYKKT